jgi:hypothetical protein
VEQTLPIGGIMNVVVDMRKSGRKEMIEGCITLFIRELKLEKSKSTLYVFSKTNFENETGAAGMVYPYAEGLITMDLDSRLGMDKLIHTLAHEMVHVRQIAKGQLAYDGRKIFWKGQRVYPKRMSYYNHPWEIDAWRNEKVLASRVWFMLEKIGAIEKVKFGG